MRRGCFDTLVDVLLFFAERPNKYFTAGDIRKRFNRERGYNDWPTHALLHELVNAGYLIKADSRNGFMYKRQPLSDPD